MSQARKKYNPAEKELLFGQVDGICPLCAKMLTYLKSGTPQKQYDLAHVYPLNPSQEEIDLLKDEVQLSSDPNDLNNIMPLCLDCHNAFDKPRTVDEYKHLYNVKKKLIDDQKVMKLYGNYNISEEIGEIINTLSSQDLGESVSKLDYSALNINNKLKPDFNQILKKHIESDATEYYNYIKALFANTEKVIPGKFDLIAGQIKTFYLNAKLETTDQERIFNKMSEWLHAKTQKGSLEACKVIIAFFIQNCEVFEYVTK